MTLLQRSFDRRAAEIHRERHDGHRADAFAATGEAEAVGGSEFDIDAAGREVEKFGDRFETFNGYVARDSELGKRLFAIVRDGHKHKLTLTVSRTGRESRVVGISALLGETWVK